MKFLFLKALTSSNGPCWIITADHRFTCWFLVLHLNSPSSWNACCIPTQLEHICVIAVRSIGDYCKTVNMKTNPRNNSWYNMWDGRGEKTMKSKGWSGKMLMSWLVYTFSAFFFIDNRPSKNNLLSHQKQWLCTYTAESLLTSYVLEALVGWGLSVLRETHKQVYSF